MSKTSTMLVRVLRGIMSGKYYQEKGGLAYRNYSTCSPAMAASHHFRASTSVRGGSKCLHREVNASL
jgi:hypothetical protein